MTILDVPYHSQEDQDAKHFANDCGAACASMLLEWGGKGRISVDNLAAKTSLVSSDDGMRPGEIVKLLKDNGLNAVSKRNVKLEDMEAEINTNQRPVIALVLYGEIPERQNTPDKFGSHYVVVVGTEGDTVYLNDPDFWGAQMARGKKLAVKRSEFVSAIAKASIPGCTVLLTDPSPIGANTQPVTQSQAMPAQTTPTTPVATGGSAAHVKTDGLWLRAAPGGVQVRILNHAESVTIQPDAPIHADVNGVDRAWVKVTTTNGDTGWCAQDFLAMDTP